MAELNTPTVSDPLVNRFFLSPQERANKVNGKAIVKAFYTQQTSNDGLNFFKERKARWMELFLWAKGSQPMKEFLDYMNVSDGNKAYVNMDMTQQRLGPQFVGTLEESMAKNKIYPCVKAIDDGSLSEKEERLFEALYRMHQVETINQFQQDSGVQLEPSNVYVPDDEMSARVHFELEDRLPKEVRFQEMLKKVMNDIHFERVANRKTLRDLIVVNFGATKIDKLSPKQYSIRKCVPTNMVYNFFINDTGDCEITMIGEFYNLKVKDYRARFGKTDENPDGLTEKQIFELARLSTIKGGGNFGYTWDNNFPASTLNYRRPYDDCSILVFDCEVNCGEDVYYVSKKDAFGKENIQVKKGIPYQQKTKEGFIEQPKPDDVEIIKKQREVWMRGVYAPYGDEMLYWGEPDIIISPYTDVNKQYSSYTVNITNNDGEYVPSIFERIMEPLREYTITKLKRKQLIASLVPHGIRIDVESARNLDLGGGDTIAWEEVVRIYKQTGHELWSSKGVDPLQPASPPLSNTVQDTSIQKVIELTNVLAGIVNEIRGLIGVPQYRDGSDVGDRTSGVLQAQQNQQSYNVTDYILNGNCQLWEETFYKLCLLHWNDIVKEEPESSDDLLNTRFDISIKMKSTDYEKEQIEKDIDRYSQVPDAMGNPSLTLKDAMMIREIEDSKLARWYLTKTYEENRRKAMEESKLLQEENAKTQQESLKLKADEDAKLLAAKEKSEKEMELFKSTQAKELASVNGLWQSIGKGIISPEIAMPIIQQLIPNIAIPVSMENKQLNQTAQVQDNPEMQEPTEQGQQELQQEPQEQEMAEQPM